MPFTISHAAVVLPFKKWCPRLLIFPALIFGSFAPDFGYFLHLWDFGAFSHTFVGSFVCDIPVALVMLLIFSRCRLALAALLPSPHQEFWSQWSGDNLVMTPKTVLQLSLSALIGSWTHIVWDSFTHSSGWCVLAIPLLAMPVAYLQGVSFPVYKILQYASSVLGLLIVGIYYRHELNGLSVVAGQKENSKKVFRLSFTAFIALLTSALVTCYYENNQIAGQAPTVFHLAFLLLINSMSIFVLLFISTSLIVSLKQKKEWESR